MSIHTGKGRGFGHSNRKSQGYGSHGSLFAAAAQKVVNAWAAKQTLNRSPSSPPTITVGSTANSTINTGQTLAMGGLTPTPSVPDGYSGPCNADSRWVVTKDASTQVESNRTFAPGNSKLFVFTGQKFDFKAAIVSGKSFTIRWSTDNGLTWNEVGPTPIGAASCWCLVDFGSAATRVVEVLCEDQLLQTYGFNFDTGAAAPAAWSYPSNFPLGAMFGDSYVFCQGTDDAAVYTSNKQWATKGMTRQMAEYLGFLQIRNHGFRTNGFSNTQSGVQSKFCDRMDLPLPADHSLSEGLVMGTMDYVVTPGSINDNSSAYDATRAADTQAYFTRLRAMQPNALIVFPVGMTPPQSSQSATWLADCKTGFNAVFGSTPSQWIANGAFFLDGSRATGANWIPSGATGSSAYYPGTGDITHPNATGHAFAAQKYGDALLYLAQQVLLL